MELEVHGFIPKSGCYIADMQTAASVAPVLVGLAGPRSWLTCRALLVAGFQKGHRQQALVQRWPL